MGMSSTNDPTKPENSYDMHFVSGIIGASAAIVALLIASAIYKADQHKNAKQHKIEKQDTTKTTQMPAKTLILDNVLNSNQHTK